MKVEYIATMHVDVELTEEDLKRVKYLMTELFHYKESELNDEEFSASNISRISRIYNLSVSDLTGKEYNIRQAVACRLNEILFMENKRVVDWDTAHQSVYID